MVGISFIKSDYINRRDWGYLLNSHACMSEYEDCLDIAGLVVCETQTLCMVDQERILRGWKKALLSWIL